MYGHEGPVMSVCWSKVRVCILACADFMDDFYCRMAQKFSLAVQTRQLACLMSSQDNPARSLHMMLLSRPSSGLMRRVESLQPAVGTRP